LQKQSKLLAAIIATLPMAITLSLWIVYAASGGERENVTQFSISLLMSIFPAVTFVFAAWMAARKGLGIGPILLIGYAVWGLDSAFLFALRTALGLQ